MDSSYKPSLSLRDISPGGRDKRLARKIYDPASLCLVSIYNELSNCYNEGIEKYLKKWGIEMSGVLAWLSGVLGNTPGKVENALIVKGIGTGLDSLAKKRERKAFIKQYYEYTIKEIYRKQGFKLVGEDALSDGVYMDAYSMEHSDEKILKTIEQWSREDKSRVMLLHGEPGNGKTTLCRKAVYEFNQGRFCKDKTNVFWFRLNPAYCDIITDRKFVLGNAFCWGKTKDERRMISLDTYEDEYKNSVIFLDGYDELKAQLHDAHKNLRDFITAAENIAFPNNYNMHIVITTRTRSLEDEGYIGIPTLEFAPISEERQDAWIEKNASGYKEDFEALRASSEEMREMLGIPILFRMVVHARLQSTTAKNVVELYDTLFDATMEQRAEDSTKTDDWHARYEQLAYEIYCNDETFADISNEELSEDFLYMFYLKGEGKQHVEFLHRSFYQYFLAYFLYYKMATVKDETSAEDFLCCLAERRIDKDVLEYIRQIQVKQERENRQKITKEICEQIVNTAEQICEIILDGYKDENEIKSRFFKRGYRCRAILVNALSICHVIVATRDKSFVISLCEKKQTHKCMQKYGADGIYLAGVNLSSADLSGAFLIDADITDANLVNIRLVDANLLGIKLIDANLSGANLKRANLGAADLTLTNLTSADLTDTCLIYAYLRHANLSNANLSNANLNGADLRWAKNLDTCDFTGVTDWSDCKILLSDRDALKLNNPDAHRIIWCDDDGDPIPPSHLSNP